MVPRAFSLRRVGWIGTPRKSSSDSALAEFFEADFDELSSLTRSSLPQTGGLFQKTVPFFTATQSNLNSVACPA